MSRTLHCSVALAVLVSPLPLLAQHGQGGGGDPPEDTYPLTMNGQPYSNVQSANLDFDRLPDIVYRVGNQIEVLLGPALFQSLMTNVATCVDYAVVSGSPRDWLLVSTSEGLDEVRWDAADVAPGNWVTTHVDTTGWTAQQIASWESVNHLTTWSSAPGQLPHVFAVDAFVGDDVLWLEPVNGVWVPREVPVTQPAPVTHLVAFDYDGVPGPELAVVTGSKLTILTPGNPTPLQTRNTPTLITTAIERLRHCTEPREWLGWLRTASNSTQYFCMVGKDEGLYGLVNLGSAPAYLAFAAGDCNGDGKDDMVYSSTATWELRWVFDQGTTAPNFLGPPPVLESDGPCALGSESSNQAGPAVVDLDGDGDCDVAYPVRFTGTMWIRYEDHFDQTAMQVWPSIVPLFDFPSGTYHQVGAYALPIRKLGLDAELGVTTQGQYLDVTAWRKSTVASQVQVPPIHRARISISDLGEERIVKVPSFVVEPDDPGNPLTGEAVFNSLVYVAHEPVDAASSDPTVPPTASYPPFMIVVHAAGAPSTPESFLQLPPNQMPFDVFFRETDTGAATYAEIGGGDDLGAGESVPGLPLPPNNPSR